MSFGDIHVGKLNETYMQIGADNAILKELSDFFSFEVPNAKFMPQVKYGMWDGKKRLFNYTNQTLYVGLYRHLQVFAADREYKIIEYDSVLPIKDVSYVNYESFMNSLNIHSDGFKITPHYFQETAILHALNNERATIVSPTSSGKSLIIYALAEWHRQNNKRIIIVVPTVSLVLQMYSDFKDYSSEIEWDVAEHCHKIYAGEEKDSIKPIIITTWQSMQKKKPSYFHKFDVVIVDEGHLAKADQLTKILESSVNASIRYGFTGTLQDTEMHKLVILGLLGPDKKIIGTKQLMDEGYVANLTIKVLLLKYSEEARKELRRACLSAKKSGGSAYQTEMEYIVSSEIRMKQVMNLCKSTVGNSLVLFQLVEKHGKLIAKELEKKTGKIVLFISGATKAEDREEIRKRMEVEENIILVASYGTFSTGVSVKNIKNVIFASPSKSKIKVLQSIGRGLRVSKTKKSVTLFDIVDDLTYSTKKTSYPNYVIKHFHSRWQFYKDEKFNVKLYERNI